MPARAPAGFVSGPSTLNTVRVPSSRRTGAAWRMAGWCDGREHEAEAEPVDRLGDPLRRLLEPEAECFEHVGRAGRRADRSVPVLGDGGARRRGDERGGRRHVERARAVASRADHVDEVVARRVDGQDVLSHRLRAAGDLVCRLALGPQRDEEPGHLRLRRLAAHDLAHHLAGLGAREVSPSSSRRNSLLDHADPAAERKFSAIFGPSGVSTDSGWNWTPSTG